MRKDITHKQKDEQNVFRSPAEQCQTKSRRCRNNNKRKKKNSCNSQQQGKGYVSNNIVGVEIHQHPFFQPEEKAEAVNRQGYKPFGLVPDGFNRFLGTNSIAFGVVENCQ